MKPTDSTAVAVAGPRRWEFGSFEWIARELAAGSKVRLTIHGEGSVVYHDVDRYSRVILPVARQH